MPALSSLARRLLPASLGSAVSSSRPWRAYRRRSAARRLARSTKRLDLVAAQVARALHLAGRPQLEGRDVLELGAGWVLSHALVFHLAGARRVVACDVERLADLPALDLAWRGAESSSVIEQLGPFCDPSRLRSRLEALSEGGPFTEARLRQLGVEYRAPHSHLEEARDGTALGEFDLVYSNSVLEHVPVPDCEPLVRALLSELRPDGLMVHAIHLEDHRDFRRDPFGFLAVPAAEFGPEEQGLRGNRLRASRWLRALAAGGSAVVDVPFRATREAHLLPARVDAGVENEGELDLRTSHLLAVVRHRRPEAARPA